jgi:hypothetical protein
VSTPSILDKKLASFLKKQRAAMPYAQWSKKTGFSPSMLFRLENCEQSITLGRLQQLMDRLKVDLDDVFGRK